MSLIAACSFRIPPRPIVTTLRALAIAALMSSFAARAPAAEVLPPLLAMSDSRLQLVAGAIVAVDAEAGTLSFNVDATLRGESPDVLQLGIDRSIAARLTPGTGYLALYSDLKPSDKPRVLVRDSSNARLLSFEGVEVSLFRDGEMARRWLRADPVAAAQETSYRKQIFSGLNASDPQWRDLWSGELALRANRLAPFSPGEIATIRSFVAGNGPAAARARLLLMAHDRSPLWGEGWPATQAAQVLAHLPIAALDAVGEQQLAYAALTIALAHPDELAPELAEAWLAAPPVFAELALGIVRAQGRDVERAVEAILDRALLPTATRRFLQDQHSRPASMPAHR